jgi:hypothetical protein
MSEGQLRQYTVPSGMILHLGAEWQIVDHHVETKLEDDGKF